MGILLEHKKLSQINTLDYVTTKEASTLFTQFSQDYIGHLLREGKLDGFRNFTGQWRVSLNSLSNFNEYSKRLEIVRKERIRFERLQEQDVQLLQVSVPQLRLSGISIQSLAVLMSGLLVGVFLFLSSLAISIDNHEWSSLASIIHAIQH